MHQNLISLADFERSSEFYPSIELLITIKSFDLQAIRKRYLASRKASKGLGGKVGSRERRDPVQGGIAAVKLRSGSLEAEVLGRMNEPRGIDFHTEKGILGIASENKIFVIDRKGQTRVLENPWFSYIHTLEFDRAGERVLVSSSGFDMIQEYALKDDFEQTFEWLAWENGFAEGSLDGSKHILTRSKEVAAAVEAKGEKVIWVNDPAKQPIPTAARAAFINSVTYAGAAGQLLATFFHEGAVYKIDQGDGSSERLLMGLRNPHGGRPALGGVMATSTGAGEVLLQMGSWQERFDFSALPGKPEELAEFEWLQNSIVLDRAEAGSLIITIDSNRNAFVVFDPAARLYDLIPYNMDWAIQDMVICEDAPVQFKAVAYLK